MYLRQPFPPTKEGNTRLLQCQVHKWATSLRMHKHYTYECEAHTQSLLSETSIRRSEGSASTVTRLPLTAIWRVRHHHSHNDPQYRPHHEENSSSHHQYTPATICFFYKWVTGLMRLQHSIWSAQLIKHTCRLINLCEEMYLMQTYPMVQKIYTYDYIVAISYLAWRRCSMIAFPVQHEFR